MQHIIFFILFTLCTTNSWALSNKLNNKPSNKGVLNHYADLAHAQYQDSLSSARDLRKALQVLVQTPTAAHLQQAREMWKAARIPYSQSEAYRYGNGIVDEWEGKVNAWPLDEGLIDYVAASYGDASQDNPLYTANIIANTQLKIDGMEVDAKKINKVLLSGTLHQIDGIESNVATGYHAIEFLLWGQDLNGADASAGNRPVTDFDVKHCTHGNCQRRIDYLLAASELLIENLQWMSAQWAQQGAARQALLVDEAQGLSNMLTGMGSISYGELAGERIKLALILHDPEEEQDCFSDNTHNANYYNIVGVENVYLGRYKKLDGTVLTGPSLAQRVAAQDKKVDVELRDRFKKTREAGQLIVDSAEKNGVAFDQLIAADNSAGNALIMNLVDALLAQTKAIEAVVTTLKLQNVAFEGAQVLNDPAAVVPAVAPENEVFK